MPCRPGKPWSSCPPKTLDAWSAPGPLSAATTWLLVRMRPSELNTMPDPSSAPCPILICSFTTLGSTFAATCSTEPDGGAATGCSGAGAAAVAAVAALSAADGSEWLNHTAAPTPPDTTATAAAPMITAPVRERLRITGIGVVGIESWCCTAPYGPYLGAG